jgi:hypothetical protein
MTPAGVFGRRLRGFDLCHRLGDTDAGQEGCLVCRVRGCSRRGCRMEHSVPRYLDVEGGGLGGISRHDGSRHRGLGGTEGLLRGLEGSRGFAPVLQAALRLLQIPSAHGR